MEQSKQQRIRELTDRLNRCRYEYYNLNAPSLTDAEYDALFDELSMLEKETGFSMTNSPTQTVGCYPAVSALVKTVHPIPLLSLDKTKSSAELLRFAGEQMVMLMLKLDGLTVKLTYENGLLMEAATRGDGDTGENITHNVLGISGIPDKIPYKERLVVTGEAFIRPSDFEALRDTLRDGNGEPYKNGRNLAAGSVRLLDCGACKDRRVTFMAFNVLEGFTEYAWKSQRLRAIEQLGFPICKYLASKQALTQFDMDAGIRHLRKYAQENDIPIDGIVVTYNDAAYQVLRKMPVPYATICKPDHGIRVLKHQMMDVLSLLLIHTIPSFAKSHQKISCHAINSRQLIYLNWWLSPCSIIVLHTDRHNLTCSGAASFNMLANSTEMLTSG